MNDNDSCPSTQSNEWMTCDADDAEPFLMDAPIVLFVRHPLSVVLQQSFQLSSEEESPIAITDLDFAAMDRLHSSAQQWRDFMQLTLQQLPSQSGPLVIIDFESLTKGGVLDRIDEWWKIMQSLLGAHSLQRHKSELMHSFICADVPQSLITTDSHFNDKTLSKWAHLLTSIENDDICNIWQLLYTYANLFGYTPIHFHCFDIFEMK